MTRTVGLVWAPTLAVQNLEESTLARGLPTARRVQRHACSGPSAGVSKADNCQS